MKITKKIISIVLAAALVLGSVAVAATAAEIVTELSGSVLTMNVTSDKDVADGKAEVKPGDTITVSVAYTTNFYPGNAGVDLFVWTAGVFDDDATVATMVGADDYWEVLNNFPLSSGYPTDYPKGTYTGYLNTRSELTEYVGKSIDVLDEEVFYTFQFTVPEDATVGSVVDFVIPESKVYGGSGSTRGYIRQNVGDSSTYNVVASSYCETVNVDSLQITIVEDYTSDDEPEVVDPVYGLEGSVLTMDVTSDKDVADGKAEVKPGETITVSVAYTTNFYPGNAGVDLFVWTAGVFDDDATVATMVGADDYWEVLNNFPLSSGYPTDYPKGTYTGYLNTRSELTEYVGKSIDLLNKEVFYTFQFTVPEDATVGSVVDFVIPESKVYGGSGSTRGYIRQNVGDSSTYNVVASSYCETVNVDSLQITIVGADETTTQEPTTEEPTTEAPVEYADLTALQAAIAKAADADTANCTAATVAEFESALAAAQALNVEGTLASEQDAVNAAATRLENAITGLTKLDEVNYYALNQAIAAYEANLVDQAKYSNWDEYTELYNTAKAIDQSVVYDDEDGTVQAAVDAAADALNDFELEEYAVVDYTALNAAIAAYDDKAADMEKYSNWAEYTELYNAAKAIDQSVVYDTDGTVQAAVDAAADALNDFELEEYAVVDYSALDAAIKAYEAKAADKDIYYNWDGYEALYDAAVEIDQTIVYDDVNGSIQAAVDQAADALNSYVLAEYDKIDYTALNNALAAYGELVKADYKPASWTASGIDAAYAAAAAIDQTAVYDIGGEQAEADAAAEALMTAIDALDPVEDKTALAAAIARAEAYVESNYTPDSWTAADLANVIAAAQTVYADADASADEIAAQVAAIEAAEAKLVIKADKADLLAAIESAQAKADNEAAYTPSSFEAADLAAVIADATTVYNDDNATAEAVANAITALAAAQAKLVEKADKTALKAAIDTEVVTENATADTLTAYNDALRAANTVYENEDATVEEVQTATNNLLAAIGGMMYLGACDYTELDKVIAEAEALDENDYTTTSWYSQAYLNTYLDAAKEVARDMIDDEAGENQATIDNAATALRNAIDALELRANLTALKEAIAKDPKVAEEYATEDTWEAYATALDAAEALAEAEGTIGVSRQAEVDAAAQALNAANEALVEKDADYTAIETALALVESKGDLNQYTTASVKVLKAALAKVVYDLGISRQDDINAWAAEITEAANNLVVSEAAVTNVEMLGGEYLARETRQYEVTVTGAPSKIQLINYKGGTQTYDRYNRNVTIVSYNADGEVVDYAEEAPAYEVWTVSMSLGAGTYQFRAKFGKVWEAFTYEFEVAIVDKAEDEVYFVAAPADGSAEAGKTLALTKNTKGVMTVITPSAATKVQLVFSIGCTSTYTSGNATVVTNEDGTKTWTIVRNFSNVGEYEMGLKIKDRTGWYDAVTEAIDVTVTK